MTTGAIVFRDEVVDGEVLHVVAPDSLSQVPAEDRYGRFLAVRAALAVRHPEFWLAKRFVGPRRFVDWLLVLLTPSGRQRVHLEFLRCAQCRVVSSVANPTIEDLYDGLPNAREVFLRSWSLPVVPCPNCGSPFERNAIWAERVPDDVLPTLTYVRRTPDPGLDAPERDGRA